MRGRGVIHGVIQLHDECNSGIVRQLDMVSGVVTVLSVELYYGNGKWIMVLCWFSIMIIIIN
jgi:hypothetical protein